MSKTNRRKVIFSLVFIPCILAFIIFMGVSTYRAWETSADQGNCANNMKSLGLAVILCKSDHYGTFPSNQWCDELLTNKEVMSEFTTNLANIFHCPTAPKNQQCSYAFNRQLAGIKETDQVAQDTVMLFESDAGWNAVGGPEIMAVRRHYSGLNVAFVDGSIEYVEYKNLGKLRWNPYTNAPAAVAK
jgi:prepilin-type processing-associated H-X9-DG protein